MNYYPDKYSEWKADHCDNNELDINYLREEMNKTVLQLKDYDNRRNQKRA